MPGGKATAGCSACHCCLGSKDVIMTTPASPGSPLPNTPVAVSRVRTIGLTTINCTKQVRKLHARLSCEMGTVTNVLWGEGVKERTWMFRGICRD